MSTKFEVKGSVYGKTPLRKLKEKDCFSYCGTVFLLLEIVESATRPYSCLGLGDGELCFFASGDTEVFLHPAVKITAEILNTGSSNEDSTESGEKTPWLL